MPLSPEERELIRLKAKARAEFEADDKKNKKDPESFERMKVMIFAISTIALLLMISSMYLLTVFEGEDEDIPSGGIGIMAAAAAENVSVGEIGMELMGSIAKDAVRASGRCGNRENSASIARLAAELNAVSNSSGGTVKRNTLHDIANQFKTVAFQSMGDLPEEEIYGLYEHSEELSAIAGSKDGNVEIMYDNENEFIKGKNYNMDSNPNDENSNIEKDQEGVIKTLTEAELEAELLKITSSNEDIQNKYKMLEQSVLNRGEKKQIEQKIVVTGTVSRQDLLGILKIVYMNLKKYSMFEFNNPGTHYLIFVYNSENTTDWMACLLKESDNLPYIVRMKMEWYLKDESF